ncbi:hypothetical protein EMIT0P4_350016 [Pseudomonas sp. IT-P4]
MVVYISISAVTASYGSAFTAGYLEKRQVTKRFCPLRRTCARPLEGRAPQQHREAS